MTRLAAPTLLNMHSCALMHAHLQASFQTAMQSNEAMRPHMNKIADDLNPLRAQARVVMCLCVARACVCVCACVCVVVFFVCLCVYV